MDVDERECPFHTEIIENLRKMKVWQRIHETASKMSEDLIEP